MLAERPRRVFTLLVEMRCNSYCVFCGLRQVDEGLVRVRARAGLSTPATPFGALRGRYTLEQAVAELREARAQGYTDLSLQGGEPTVFSDIVEVVRQARALGFAHVGIVTNARKLADARFAADLMGAGLDGITVSLVGWNAETHDAIALVPGAFDELVAGLKNAVAAARDTGARVTINANVITSAKTVEHLPEQVRLLAELGAQAVVVHLVRFDAMGSETQVKDALRFDVRRITPALARARSEALRLGIALHASDVPMCLHPTLDAEDLRVLGRRARTAEHKYQGAALAFDGTPRSEIVTIAACEGCLLARVCPRVPPGHLPADPAAAYRALDPGDVERRTNDQLSELDPTGPDAARALADMARSIEALAQLAQEPSALEASQRRVDQALFDLVALAGVNRQIPAMVEALYGYLALKLPERFGWEWALDAVEWSPPTLLRQAGAVAVRHAGDGPRLRFGPRFEIALEGARIADDEMALTRARPILHPANSVAERFSRALFLCGICAPIRGAKRIRVLEDRVLVDSGSGYRTVWTMLRPRAVTLRAGGE